MSLVCLPGKVHNRACSVGEHAAPLNRVALACGGQSLCLVVKWVEIVVAGIFVLC